MLQEREGCEGVGERHSQREEKCHHHPYLFLISILMCPFIHLFHRMFILYLAE